jgi:DNA-binding response OmpR family regulator
MAGNGRHFLAKPFQPKDLLAKIRSLLDKRTGEA